MRLRLVGNPPLGDSLEKSIKQPDDRGRIDLGCVLESGSFKVSYDKEVLIEKSIKEEALIYFFLNLLMELQKLGTIPALDIAQYAKALYSI
jgi:hypothetical protein